MKQTPAEEDISWAVVLQSQMEIYEAGSDTEGKPERIYLEQEASPTVSVTSHDDTNST